MHTLLLLLLLLLLRCCERLLARSRSEIVTLTTAPRGAATLQLQSLRHRGSTAPVTGGPVASSEFKTKRLPIVAHMRTTAWPPPWRVVEADGSRTPRMTTTLPHYARPLPHEEAHTLWQRNIGEWFASHAAAHATRGGQLPSSVAAGCPQSCGPMGVCHAELGACVCSSGWAGELCTEREEWACNAADGRYLWTRCAGRCDTRYGQCYCGERGTYSERPLLQCEPKGIERVVTPWKVHDRSPMTPFPHDP